MIFRSKHSIGKLSKIPKRSVGAAFQAKQNRQRKVFSFFRKIFLFFTILFTIGVIVLAVLVFRISHDKDFPDISSISTYMPCETTKIYSEDNVVLAELHREENRDLVEIDKIAPFLKAAVIALEDTDFYKHHGINIKGILRALYKDIKARRFVEGGSTITQQLARNLFLSQRKKLIRKLAEVILAIQIERKYTKEDILGMYLNQVYWGHNAYGIQSASIMFFGKKADQLNLSESALLVGMLKGPELYSPFRDLARSKKRQRVVLNRMASLGVITKQQADDAFNEPLMLSQRKKLRYKAPYFTSYIIKKLIDMYGEEATYTAGMKIYTTLNYKLQQKAEQVVTKYVEKGKKPIWAGGEQFPSANYSQAAILALEPTTGYVKVMQGGYDFLENQFNRCVQAKRQPGSAFKPFVYLAALEKGFSPGTIIEDSPVTFNTIEGPYAPNNYTQKYLGRIPVRKALEQSVNVVAIKLNDLVGPKNVAAMTRKFGFSSSIRPVLSLPLGANEVSMLEMATAYGVFANYGRLVKPITIKRIEDREGIKLYEHEIEETKQIDENLIATLIELLRGVVNYGTGKNAKLPRPVAGKTGTTSDYRDAWFVGFVPQLVCVAWLGNDDNTPTNKMVGGRMPALMWKEFMTEALKNVPFQDFRRPKGLVQRKINWQTGKLANEYSPPEHVHVEKYWKGSEPKEEDGPSAQVGTKSESEKTDELIDFFR